MGRPPRRDVLCYNACNLNATYQLGWTEAARKAQQTVGHVKNALQIITNEGTPRTVTIINHVCNFSLSPFSSSLLHLSFTGILTQKVQQRHFLRTGKVLGAFKLDVATVMSQPGTLIRHIPP